MKELKPHLQERADKITLLAAAPGASVAQIAETLSVKSATVYAVMKKHGIKLPSAIRSDDKKVHEEVEQDPVAMQLAVKNAMRSYDAVGVIHRMINAGSKIEDFMTKDAMQSALPKARGYVNSLYARAIRIPQEDAVVVDDDPIVQIWEKK
jgi:hypothetical protein